MDSDALKTFVTIHRANGFSSAADVLHRSQPAISRRIALLEAEVGAPLFERVAGGAVLSQAGRTLLPHAERVLSALNDAAQALQSLRSENAGSVSLAVVGTLANTELTDVLKRFSARFPKAEIALRTATSTEVSELVRRGEADIGLRYFDDPSPDLICSSLAPEKLTVVCGRGHKLAGKSVPSLATLRGERWLAFPLNPARTEAASHMQTQFLSRGMGDVRWTPVDSLTAQKRLVEAGFGIALLPERSIAEERSAKTIATIRVGDLKAVNPVTAIVRKSGYLNAAAKRLLSILRS